MFPRPLLVISLLTPLVLLTGCADDDCTITLTCPRRNDTGGDGGGGSGAGNGGTTADGGGGAGGAKKANGIGCGDGTECDSQLCVDGVCCASTCEGECETCNASGSAGVCSPQAPGTDPDAECGMGLCSGASSCALGTELWSVPVTGTFDRISMAVDSTGAIVLAGAAGGDIAIGGTTIPGGGFEKSVFVVKLGTDGAIIWSQVEQIATIDYIGSAGIALDPDDGIIVAGYANTPADLGGPQFGGSVNGDLFAVRLQPDGQHDWTRVFTAAALFSGPRIDSMATNAAGATFVFGTLFDGDQITICNKTLNDGGSGAIFGFKLAADGACQWAHRWSAAAQLAAIATDGTSVFLTGSFQGTLDFGGNQLTTAGSDSDVFVAALDAAVGTHSWSKDFGDASMQHGEGIAVHSSGDVLIAGYAAGNIDFGGAALAGSSDDDIVVARLSPSGAHVSSVRYGDSSTQRARDIAVAPSGQWHLAGEVSGALDLGSVSVQTTELRPVASSFHEGGTALWAHALLNGTTSEPALTRMAVAANGEVVMLGHLGHYAWRLVRYAP